MITNKTRINYVNKTKKYYANKIISKTHDLLHYAKNPLFRKVTEKEISEK